MKPIFPIVTNIDIPPFDFEYTAARIPRCFIETFSSCNAYIFWSIVMSGLFAGQLFATQIVVRRESDGLIAIATDSRRGRFAPDGTIDRSSPNDAICKVCEVKNGIFATASMSGPFCDMAKELSDVINSVTDRTQEFASEIPRVLQNMLRNMPPPIFNYYTLPTRDLLQFTFIGIDHGVTSYGYASVATRASSRNGVEVYVRSKEICPPQCRPNFTLGSATGQTYIETNLATLLALPAIDFVRKVVNETIKVDPAVGGRVAAGTMGPFTFNLVDPGTCRSNPANNK